MVDAVVVPGGRYGPGAPLPMYVGDVAGRRGANVLRHSWSRKLPTGFGPQLDGPLLGDWVRGEVTPVLDRIGHHPLLIGKSLGTFAAALAAERSLPAVWLTPLLTVPRVVAALQQASAPFLLVGGTADDFWDGVAARRLTPYVCEVDGADHGMYVPGPLTDSIAVLARVIVAVEGFLDAIDWPS